MKLVQMFLFVNFEQMVSKARFEKLSYCTETFLHQFEMSFNVKYCNHLNKLYIIKKF